MLKTFHDLRNDLRERLLRAGVAPRHARRYLTELAEHHADLAVEGERSGRSRAEAESVALTRLGEMEDLAKAMIEQRHFHSWSSRLPWATFVFFPVFLLAGAYSLACLILWSGWKIFLPESSTPFVPIDGFAIFYFGVGRLLYYCAPILIGWGVALMAYRQRLERIWPAVGALILALMGGTADVHTSRPPVPGGVGDVSMSFIFGPSDRSLSYNLVHVLIIFSLIMLPYLLWRMARAIRELAHLAPVRR